MDRPDIYNTPSPMKVSQMGECTNLWHELVKSPLCVIGGFTLNLADLRRLTGDTATLSVGLMHFLENSLYVKDSSANPDGLSIVELYRLGAAVDVVFDPLRSVELDWSILQNLLERKGYDKEYNALNYEELMDQMETRIALFANRPLQRKLVKRLREKQKQYLHDGKWYHLHERIYDFWNIAYDVCLGKPITSSVTQRHAQSEMLNWIFLANDNNRAAYRRYLHTYFEEEHYMSSTLGVLLTLTEKLVLIIGKESRGKTRPANYKITVLEAVTRIVEYWSHIWNYEYRIMLDTPLARNFRENMDAIELLLLTELIPLSSGNRKVSPRMQSETFATLRELLLTAIEGWKNLVRFPVKSAQTNDLALTFLKQELDDIIDRMGKSVPDIVEPDSDDSND